jgi:hypothetical protein
MNVIISDAHVFIATPLAYEHVSTEFLSLLIITGPLLVYTCMAVPSIVKQRGLSHNLRLR